jgi:hypothetical protein
MRSFKTAGVIVVELVTVLSMSRATCGNRSEPNVRHAKFCATVSAEKTLGPGVEAQAFGR